MHRLDAVTECLCLVHILSYDLSLNIAPALGSVEARKIMKVALRPFHN